MVIILQGYIPDCHNTITTEVGDHTVSIFDCLDYHTEGLLLLTNDGELAQLLQHPRYGIPKTYAAKVKGLPTEKALRRLRSGVVIDGRRTAPASVKKIGTTGKNAWLEITIKEGRNRQVRRMCYTVGHPVMKLKRTRYGPVTLGPLPPGMYRELNPNEMKKLKSYFKSSVDRKSRESA